MSITKQLADALSECMAVIVTHEQRPFAGLQPLYTAVDHAKAALAAYEAEDAKRQAEEAIKHLECCGWEWDGESWLMRTTS